MLHQFPFYLILIVFIILLVMLADKIKIAYPIVLVIGGLLVSFIPSIPQINIDHELIFIIFLPPLLYEAAWSTSWKEFWRWRRVIGSFATIIVIVTSLVVAWVASSMIPGFSLALGFLLGGIVSPPDAVSASAVLKYVKVPKRMASIAEGESLLNDASSLVVFRFALIAVETGQFIFYKAALSFLWVILAGIAIGIIVGYIFYLIHKKLPTNVNSNIVFTLVTPYAMYIVAESLQVSGVLAVVSGGLFLSARRQYLMDNSSRLQARGVWSAIGFVLNGLVFMLIGLELPVIINDLNGANLATAIGYGALITGVLIVSRLLSTIGSSYFTIFISRYITTADSRPGLKMPLAFGWMGMRGVVSLAAALSIPTVLPDGSPFPERSLILFITFIVILLTLVAQGLTLPWVIKKLKMEDPDQHMPEAEENMEIHHKLARQSIRYLQKHFPNELKSHPALAQLVTRWENMEWLLDNEIMHLGYKDIYLKLLGQQREWLFEWNKDINADEGIIRKHLLRLDLEEEKMRFS